MAKARIPGGITAETFLEIRNLLNRVLQDIDTTTRAEPKWVSTRLNETGRDDLSPYFVGWVEHKDLIDKRVRVNDPDPGLYRFGDDRYSQIYEDCLKNPGVVQKRDWTKDVDKWIQGAKTLSVKAGVMYRRSIGIKVDGRCVGTLNVGIGKVLDANTDREVEQALKKWAEDSTSGLVRYLRDNFELGGPTV